MKGHIMQKPKNKPVVKLIGESGNAFPILGRVKHALLKAGADQEYIDKYLSEATSGDYKHLLTVTMKYVEIE